MNRSVLLLNASYEPLGIVGTPRAVLLLWKGAAEIVEQDGVLRSQYTDYPAPSVIRLLAYIDVFGRQRRSSSKRTRVLARDKYRCAYCGTRGDQKTLTIDHIFPVSRGGETSGENLVAACFDCNQRKGNRTPEESGLKLKHRPAPLAFGINLSVLQHEAEKHPLWHQFLFMTDSKLAHFADEHAH